MKIMKRNPEVFPAGRPERGEFLDHFRHFFDNDFLSSGFLHTGWNPRVDVYEKDGNIIVKADIPGVEEKNLSVELEGKYLTIKGTREEESEKKGKDFYRLERSSGSFSRTINLPDNVKEDDIDASYSKGVLTLTIPKSHETESKKINVKIS